MKKLIVFLADGFEEIEALTIVDVLRRAGVETDICSIKNKEVIGAHNIKIIADKTLDEINENDYSSLYLPGGMPGAENLKNNEKLINIIKKFDKENKKIFAICAAPIVLSKANVLKKEATSYPSFKEQIKIENYSEKPFVIDENIGTSRGPATALEFSFQILKELGFSKEAEELKISMLYNYFINQKNSEK
ncbi:MULTISPECIES: DJ-1 family glyoxalase III [Oceanotoga]|jgi:4-methyl-5(b-hydroxyethyl)-thiazole monophosphate biosynthesis|uniref:4-methyl-5(B-hydroxyethyl)-thiazole monophosphate biosynthesis n=1 Tax=Oceanotoga teriensis TaxID=515440 RepID=A0AA45C6Q8_9BACT|nr:MULTISPECIES: DJ-1 family glyoxalase III [Oceanotoga]MDN5342824.1 protein deglycase [Oceanotoga sp.]MDO7977215.1 DJ-1/PfpI family protein [Oceanotoga teriensis]PWJ93206.1 4-methyl-5(b-hydroxyethyl)-thiazole monophosphate biosynthesis [Oceanotoga teriensis]